MQLIAVENLEKTYGSGEAQTKVLRGIDFTISQGEFVAVMGPSGSGKSTILHILGLLDRLTGGGYVFEGKNIEQYSEVELAHIRNKKMGFVFQAFNLLARTSVLENVGLPLIYSGISQTERIGRAKQAIANVGLEHRMYYQSAQLSGGEKQRVAIARALINQPAVIFADEPTGNLDSKSGEVVMNLFRKLNQQGHTIILITHETYTAEYAGRIIRLHDGKIAEDKRTEQRRSNFIK